MKIYLASSRRNPHYEPTLALLRSKGYEVYDFKDNGLEWSLGDNGTVWGNSNNPNVVNHFQADEDALKWCDAVVMVLPCGKSAHMEFGWGAGAGKLTYVYIPEGVDPGEPELMYRLGTAYLNGESELTMGMAVARAYLDGDLVG